MKKFIQRGFIALALIVFIAGVVPGAAHAQTASSSAEQVASLMKMIADLQAKITLLTTQQVEIKEEIHETIALIRDLREGMTGEEVKALQEILATDPDIYPEGKVTGFYGTLTKKAVKKFQLKHGLDQAGVVGPKTRAKINELLGKSDFKCKAWGHLFAPGYLKKLGNASMDLSSCGKLPHGIEKKLEGEWKKDKATTTTATTTDKIAPIIRDIDVDNVSTSTATVSWRTNEKTKAVLWYSTKSNVDINDNDTKKESFSSYKLEYEIDLTDLAVDTRYYYLVVATDQAGNSATSSISNFETDED